VGIAHDLAFLNLTVLLEEPSDLLLCQLGMNAGDEEIRTRVGSSILIAILATLGCAVAVIVHAAGRHGAATAGILAVITTGRSAAVTVIVARGVGFETIAISVLVVHLGGRHDGYCVVCCGD
jgi:hypothetical protein